MFSNALVGVEASRRLSPARSPVKPVTPSSVKILMVVEAAVVAFLAYWILSEYAFNAYFHDYVDQLLGTRGTTFTAAIGLGIGLAGSAIAATVEESQRASVARVTAPSAMTLSSSSPGAAPVPALPENEQKKLSDTKP